MILASASPQRREILSRLGVPFTIEVSGVVEIEEGPPHEVAIENAYRKAARVANRSPEATVLGVDTVVARGACLYGKAESREQARATLSALSGRRHVVIGGACLIEAGRTRTLAASTTVQFRALDERTIERYLDTEEWRDRAGAYAIQGRGALLVASIEGDYWNVVGLPLAALVDIAPQLFRL